MSFNAFPYVVSWIVLTCVVLALAAYKGILFMRSGREEFPPHIFDMQKGTATRIGAAIHLEEAVEKWGKVLTLVTLLYGLAIAGVYGYQILTTTAAY